MKVSMLVIILGLAFRLAVLAGVVYLAILVARALRKYLRAGPARKEKAEDRRSLGEVLKEQRLRCQMTQEFVAESVEQGFTNLKGHRSVGGMRASIYNAMPPEGIDKLVDFMEKFRKENA